MPLQSEWVNATDAAVDEKLGIVTVKVPFTITPGDSKLATLRYALSFRPDDIEQLGLPLVKRDVKERSDGAYDVSFNFDGHFTPESADGEEYSLDGSTSDEKIEAHPEIAMLVKRWYPGKTLKSAPNEQGEIIFPSTIKGTQGSTNVDLYVAGLPIFSTLAPGDVAPESSGSDSDEIPNPLHGIRTYLEDSLVWTRTRVRQDFDEGLVRQLGCIGSPPVGRLGQRPPSGREWIMIRVRADWRGNVWKMADSWLQSGRGGFPPGVYRYR